MVIQCQLDRLLHADIHDGFPRDGSDLREYGQGEHLELRLDGGDLLIDSANHPATILHGILLVEERLRGIESTLPELDLDVADKDIWFHVIDFHAYEMDTSSRLSGIH